MPRPPYVNLNECSPMMRKAAATLKASGIRFQIKTVHHIKVGSLNYYPVRGTIFRDGDAGALQQNGLQALLALVRPCSREERLDEAESPAGPAVGLARHSKAVE